MIDDDKKAFAAQMSWLAEMFAERVSPVRMAGYFQALAEFSIEDVRLAVAEIVKHAKFFPKPAEMIESARHFKGVRMRTLRAQQQPALPKVAAADDDICPECGKTVAEHRQEFRELVNRIGSEEHLAELSARPSLLERRGVHPMREKAKQWVKDHPDEAANLPGWNLP